MRGQLWAIIEDGNYRLIWTASAKDHPRRTGHADECRGRKVVALDREPNEALGEYVTAEGEIGFDVSRIAAAVTGRIKEAAARRIEAVAPIWRQLNDLADPSNPDCQRRRQQIDAIRAWSNEAERKLLSAQCVNDVVAVLADLEEGN